MPTDLFIPKLGQTVEEVTLVQWMLSDGSKVDFGDPVLDVETDKAVFPVEANAKGFIHFGPYKEGDVVPVLTVVATIGKQEEKFSPSQSKPSITADVDAALVEKTIVEPSNTLPVEYDDQPFVSPRARKLAAAKGVDLAHVAPTGYGGARVVERDVISHLSQSPKISPVAQKMAADLGVEVQAVEGSGIRGRIVKEDIQRAISTREISQAGLFQSAGDQVVPQAPPTHSIPIEDVIERIPLKGVRAIIAERMGASVHTTARVTLMMEVDATEFVAARTRLKDRVAEEWGFAPGYNDLLAKVVGMALRKFPYVNARLTPDAVELLGHVNIGMAVDTDRGLMVPVIRDVDIKNLHQIGEEFRQLVERARQGRSFPDDLTGGTFTITNLGMYEIDAFTPVINLPEAAILGVGRIAAKPIARGNQVEIRKMWTLSLVFDHRLVDGAPAAQFLQYIKQLIEEPYLLLT
jgi:pyruvate dehydrogenase E2 component (dihydrolipoamide acetyltransferase)